MAVAPKKGAKLHAVGVVDVVIHSASVNALSGFAR
jgi:hypothetical protein